MDAVAVVAGLGDAAAPVHVLPSKLAPKTGAAVTHHSLHNWTTVELASKGAYSIAHNRIYWRMEKRLRKACWKVLCGP